MPAPSPETMRRYAVPYCSEFRSRLNAANSFVRRAKGFRILRARLRMSSVNTVGDDTPKWGIEWGNSAESPRSHIALDVTRLIALRWSGALATGIDRVSYAYMLHYKSVARAVVQHRGLRRVLTAVHSAALFDLLLNTNGSFRKRLMALAPAALSASSPSPAGHGAFYLNVGHTDIDRQDLSNWVNACGFRAIYMIHDLIPLTHAEFCEPRATERHRARVNNALAHASGILTNSASSANDIRHHANRLGIQPPPILPNWLAGARLSGSCNGPPRPKTYFIYISTIEGRKNHFMLLQIWRSLIEKFGDKAPHLVIVGKRGAQASHVFHMLSHCQTIQRHVTVMSGCRDEELGYWLSGARALLFPSFAEGFGLPLIESLQLGIPVIASDIATFREVGQEIPTFLDPLDASAWAETIARFADGCPERDRQLREVDEFRAPTWADHFSKVDHWLSSMRPTAKFLRFAVQSEVGHSIEREIENISNVYRKQSSKSQMSIDMIIGSGRIA